MAFGSSSKIFSAYITDALNNTAALDANSDTIKVALYGNSGTPDQTAASLALEEGSIDFCQGIPKTDMDLHIFDLDGNRLKALNFRPIGLEPEGIDIQNGWIYVAFHTPKKPRHSNIWRFKLKD